MKPTKPFSSNPKHLFRALGRTIIRSIPTSKAEYQKKKVPFFILIATVFLAGLIIGKITFTTIQYVRYFDLRDIFGLFTATLQKDDKGRVNVLVLGTGGGIHEGPNLTDTILLASINERKGSLSLLSIPRDLWLDLPGFGSSRINKMYEILKDKYGSEQALDILRKGIENITNVKIPYLVKVDFEAFTKAIDIVDGIEIDVEKKIYDPEYPNKEENGYEVFELPEGLQTLDGRTALKYVRSRHSTSDFDRSRRQHQVISAIMKKISEEKSFLTSPLTIKRFYETYSENVETNMRISELITLADLGLSLDREKIASGVLKDFDVLAMGSFLYTPEREQYGGAFVLIPRGETYIYIQKFITLLFDYPEFFQEKAVIEILNGTGVEGLAAAIGDRLIPYGFEIKRYGNTKKGKGLPKTTHYLIRNPDTEATEQSLQFFFPRAMKVRASPFISETSKADITLILGEDADPEEF